MTYYSGKKVLPLVDHENMWSNIKRFFFLFILLTVNAVQFLEEELRVRGDLLDVFSSYYAQNIITNAVQHEMFPRGHLIYVPATVTKWDLPPPPPQKKDVHSKYSRASKGVQVQTVLTSVIISKI